MSKVNYHVLNNSIIIDCNDKLYTINVGSGLYARVLACIQEDRLDDISDLVDVEASFKKAGLDLIDGVVHVDGQALPTELSARIVAFKDNGLPFEPLLKFWEKLKKNPSFNSRRMLYKFLEHNGHPLTTNGNFIAYRGVTADFKDCHTRTFDNSVGAVCEVPRDQVDDNPNNTCSYGLHVAAHSYAYGFGAKLVKVEVDPQDVVCVPTDYDGTKMRVAKFKVVAECENLDTSHLVDSHTEEDDLCPGSYDCEYCGDEGCEVCCLDDDYDWQEDY